MCMCHVSVCQTLLYICICVCVPHSHLHESEIITDRQVTRGSGNPPRACGHVLETSSLRASSHSHIQTNTHNHTLLTISTVSISSSAGKGDLSPFHLSSFLYIPGPLSHSSSSAQCLPTGSGRRGRGRWGEEAEKREGKGLLDLKARR